MTLEDIMTSWSKDCDLDRTELGEEAMKIPKLHSKYFNIFSSERLTCRKLESEMKILKRQKYEYYNGTLDYDELTQMGWEPNPLKILRTDIPQYIDSDKMIIELMLKIAYQQEKVEFLESAIRSLNSRGFNIKAAIEWEKFKVGL
tara:strand:- start:4945 stop:5379 length:435 start_codon:yes stop_codon:yes gene_type:complete